MTEQNKNKKFRFNIRTMITAVVIILIAGIAFGVYRYWQNENEEQVITAIKDPQETATPTATSETVELPEEATTLGSYQYLLNKNSASLDASYEPDDLVDPENVSSTSGVFTVRSEVATQLQSMIEAASNDGITILVSSGYRSYEEQEQLYTSKANLLSESAALTACAKSGYSEHQLGLAVDLTDDAETPNQTVSFAETDAGQWLMNHAHEYGFILRYPDGKQSITKYDYMPWHYRYVGTDVANAMYENGLDYTLEEYFGQE